MALLHNISQVSEGGLYAVTVTYLPVVFKGKPVRVRQ